MYSFPKSIGHAFAEAARRIDAADVRVLLCHVLRRDAAHLIAHADDLLESEPQRTFEALVARRASGEPVAYITGRREFFGLEFKVTPAVLIPRPETELLVALALERIPQNGPCRVLDLGTGSGCVAIAIARHRSKAQVVAVDTAEPVLAVARENGAALLGSEVASTPRSPAEQEGGISFVRGKWYEALGCERFNVIVANPPYVAEADPHLTQGDLRFEPRGALIGGPDGLDALRLIVAGAERHLVPGGWLLFEHGYDQAARCRALLHASGLGAIQSWKDLAGHERVTGGKAKLDESCLQPVN